MRQTILLPTVPCVRWIFACGLTAVFVGCAAPSGVQPPVQPDTGPGGREYRFQRVRDELVGQGATAAHMYVPRGIPRGERLPLVVFLHGYQAVEEFYYVAWIEHLVKRGAVVLYPTWQHRTSRLGALTRNAVTGVETGMRWLLDEGVAVDPARVIFIGHSGGATLAVNLGVLAAQDNLVVKPRALLLAAPGRCVYCEQFGVVGIPFQDPSLLNRDVRLVVMGYQDDDVVGLDLGRFFFEQATSMPRESKSFLMVQTDETGSPTLLADHRTPAAATWQALTDWKTDSLDYFGTWKIADALMACAFEGRLCDVALGEGPAQKSMGAWSDGTPVLPMLNDWEL